MLYELLNRVGRLGHKCIGSGLKRARHGHWIFYDFFKTMNTSTVSKEWTAMVAQWGCGPEMASSTRHEPLLKHLDLRCQQNHPKGKCESGEAAHTARYTEPFVRKVIDALTECETWSRLVGEFDKKETVEVAQAAGQVRAVAEGEILTEEERQQVIAKIQHIHRSTGHGSIHNLVKALEDRGCHPRVVRIAREWKCSVCDHRKRRDPRRFATLETIPQKWERVQLDFATWMHPRTKIKYHILVIIDEATRFRMARVTAEGKGNTTKWDNIREVLEQQWFSIFGWPQVLRTNSAGPWCSDEADRYCADKGIELIPIPGEAHWQASIVEGAIKSLKGMLETLSREFPEIEVTELLARSVWVCNSEEQYKGCTPIQQVLGRAPDSTGRLFESEDTRPIHPGLLDDGGFKEDVKMRCAATKAFAEEQAKRRLNEWDIVLNNSSYQETLFIAGGNRFQQRREQHTRQGSSLDQLVYWLLKHAEIPTRSYDQELLCGSIGVVDCCEQSRNS